VRGEQLAADRDDGGAQTISHVGTSRASRRSVMCA
jgi:hypothetical protein